MDEKYYIKGPITIEKLVEYVRTIEGDLGIPLTKPVSPPVTSVRRVEPTDLEILGFQLPTYEMAPEAPKRRKRTKAEMRAHRALKESQ